MIRGLSGPVSLSICAALLLSGCSVSSGDPIGDTLEAERVSEDTSACIAIGDVLTIVTNADIALQQGRAETQERDGWYRLATRVLDRIPTSGEGAVHSAVVQLKEAAPSIPLGANRSSGISSDEWFGGLDALMAACSDIGVETGLEAFTGG